MKTVKITTENLVSVVDVNFDDFRSIQAAVGGHFKTVHTRIMQDYFRRHISMLVDEEFLLKGLPANRLGCCFYGTLQHGHPIAGDVILTEHIREDLAGLDDAEEIAEKLARDFKFLKREDI